MITTFSHRRSGLWIGMILAFSLAAGHTHRCLAQGARETAEIAWEEGLEAYLEGEYEAALEAYQRAEATGQVSGELLYNMGNTYFRLNRLGKAILYYERARRLIPGDELLNHSLRIAQRKSLNRFAQIPRPIWAKYWDSATARLGAGWMYFVGLCFYLSGVVFLGYRIWTKSRNEWVRRVFALSLVAALPLLALSFKASVDTSNREEAVITQTRVELRESPSEVGTTETTLFEGLIVEIVDRSEGWVELRLPDGATGWVEGTAIEEV